MKIANNIQKNVAFGSIYKYNVTTQNMTEALGIEDKFYDVINSDGQFFADFPSFPETCRSGIQKKVHICTANKYGLIRN